MTVALILLALIAGTGLVLYLEHRSYLRRQARKNHGEQAEDRTAADAEPSESESEECCGMHITCEKDSLLASVSPEIVYYDDEELDRFAGRSPEDFSDQEIEEFRDILITMQPHDIAGWARSLQLRHIPIPPAVRDELIMIVAEARAGAGS